MKKPILFGIIGVVIVSIVAASFFLNNSGKVNPTSRTGSSGVSVPPKDVTYDNMVEELSSKSLVKDLPDDGIILFRFFNFDTGERTWEKSYVLEKNNVYEGTVENPDITIFIHSKYLAEWNSANFCSVMAKANKNGDLGYDTSLSDLKLAWKFKSLNDYRSCFGMG